MLAEEGQFESARTLYASIDGNYELDEAEIAEFAYGDTLLAIRAAVFVAGASLKDLSEDQVGKIEDVVENATAWAKIRAQNWLTLYDGRQYEDEILHVEIEEEPEFRKTMVTDATKLYPNPVGDVLTVSYANKGEGGSMLQVMDVTGRNVLAESLEGLSGQKLINTSRLMPGIYLYKIMEKGNTTLQGKFVKE